MKILILQLARLGDVYLTWPIHKAIKRRYPDAELHFMTRESFSSALLGLESIDRSWKLDIKQYLKESIESQSSKSLDLLLDELKSQSFDKVFNLSFSPLSSYITDYIATESSEICGYTRNTDGSFAIPDDASAYFYAQVGNQKNNRLHLTKIFSSICGVDIIDEDWSVNNQYVDLANEKIKQYGLKKYFVIHVGASSVSKTIPVSFWRQLIEESRLFWKEQIVLIGSRDEESISQEILSGFDDERIINLVGKTSLQDVFSILKKSKLLIGGDSSPMHMASLLDTACLNLSNKAVNFWETGPLSTNTQICKVDNWNELNVELVCEAMMPSLTGVPVETQGFIRCAKEALESYEMTEVNFSWDLIKAIYLGEEFPIIDQEQTFIAVQEIRELCRLAVDQLGFVLDSKRRENAVELIERCSELIHRIKIVAPEIAPLIDWFETEKIRITPGSFESIISATTHCFVQLNEVLNIYLGPDKEWLEPQNL